MYAVLNWGLGHATRSLPVIKKLQRLGHHLIIVSDGIALELLRKEIPNARFVVGPGYNIDYKSHNMAWSMISQLGKIRKAISKEQDQTARLVKLHHITLIISDHRYGYTCKDVKSIFLAHQLTIAANYAFISYVASMANNYWIKKFDEIWVPDYADRKLSGKLSNYRGKKKPHFIGPLSRLKPLKAYEKDIDILMILSGVEPKRTILEKKLTRLTAGLPLKKVLVRGSLSTFENNHYYKTYQLANTDQIEELLHRSRCVITRSGYSSIMDLHTLSVPTILIPTPGQTEQEYLARHINLENFTCLEEADLEHKLLDSIYKILNLS